MTQPTTLILIPGLLCDATVWEPQARALSSVARIQIANHGMLDSLGAMADAILGQAPARFALAGHSMGGRVAFEVVRRAAERVEGLAILDSGCAPLATGEAGAREVEGRRRLVALARSGGMRAMGEDWLRMMIHPARQQDQALTTSILDMIGRNTPDMYEAQVRALLARPDARPLLPTIACPTLVLCGHEDTWAPVAQHEEMAALIPGSRLVVIPECGHMSTLERPDAVSAALRGWFGSPART